MGCVSLPPTCAAWCDEPDAPVCTVDPDGVDRSNPNYDVWPGGFTVGKGEIFDPTTYIHPSRRNDLVWP